MRTKTMGVVDLPSLMERVRVTETGCWEYVGSKVRKHCRHHTYAGGVVMGKVVHGMHRAVWELFNGPMRTGMLACHKCNNKRCVRPDPNHVYEAAPSQNIQDREDRIAAGGLADYRKNAGLKRRLFNQMVRSRGVIG